MKNINWNVKIYNPLSREILSQQQFKSIEDIKVKYPDIPLSTWRNISIGRSKVYNKFIEVEKIMLNKKVTIEPMVAPIIDTMGEQKLDNMVENETAD
tara:strand:+ start:2593 stop:2883 length:291 start_codon:yes stop_codon:yes gene_type:complete